MAVQPRFCGRCGAQLHPSAVFCGRCGMPQFAAAGGPQYAAAVATPQLAGAVAAPPAAPPAAYGYRLAQPDTFPRPGRVKVSQPMVIGGLLLILAVATVSVSALAVVRAIGGTPHSTCTANCSPKIVTPLSEPNTYRSASFNFEVDYSSDWKARGQDANGVSLGTRLGRLDVVGSRSQLSLNQLIDGTVSALPTSTWQSVSRVSDLKGAHIGDQDGLGAVYSANLVGSGATATKVRFAVIAATRGGVSVVIFALDPAAPKTYPNGMPEGQDFDYLCQEFRWSVA